MSFFNELRRRNVIRVAAGYVVLAWLAVQVVETIFPAFGFGDGAVRAVVLGFAVGFIPIVIAAWVFEWTPQGIRKDDGLPQEGRAVAAAAKRWDRVVMIVLAIAVAYFIVEKILDRPIETQPSITVVPFTASGSDPDVEYLAHGIAEGVHGSLARIPALVVSALPTVLRLHGEGLSASQIAERLQTPNVLQGTVQKIGDRVRVRAELVATDSERTVWSEIFEGASEDIFDFQDAISSAVAKRLNVGDAESLPRGSRTNPEAYRLTVQAWSTLYRVSQNNTGGVARSLLEQALAIDPDYLPALNGMRFATYNQIQEGTLSREEGQLIDRQIRERVLALDPENSIANAYLAWSTFWDLKEFSHANLHLQIALRTGMNDGETLRVLAGFARRTGNAEAAILLAERAISIDPTCENCMWQVGENLFYARRFEEAIEAKIRFQAFGAGGHANHAHMLLALGRPEEALEVAAKIGSDFNAAEFRAMAYYALGDSAKFDEQVSMLKQSDDDQNFSFLAAVYAFTGDTDSAFTYLEKAAETDSRFQYDLYLPHWDSLRSDPRWLQFRERLNMRHEDVSKLDFSEAVRSQL